MFSLRSNRTQPQHPEIVQDQKYLLADALDQAFEEVDHDDRVQSLVKGAPALDTKTLFYEVNYRGAAPQCMSIFNDPASSTKASCAVTGSHAWPNLQLAPSVPQRT